MWRHHLFEALDERFTQMSEVPLQIPQILAVDEAVWLAIASATKSGIWPTSREDSSPMEVALVFGDHDPPWGHAFDPTDWNEAYHVTGGPGQG